MPDPEQLTNTGERKVEGALEAANQQAERLRSSQERVGELSPDRQAEKIEKARAEATKEALMSKEAGKEANNASSERSAPAIRRVTKQEKEHAYKNTLSRVQSHLSGPSRVFSKTIHNPTIERVSDIGAKTIARPNAILAGGISAFVLSGIIYFIARTFGYPLSGFETIGAFIIGFILGIVYDFLKAMITGQRNS